MVEMICGLMRVAPNRGWMIRFGSPVSDTVPKLLGWAGDFNAFGT
jgi:hypothetical protein